MENSDSKKENLQLLIEATNSLDTEGLRSKVIEYIIRNQYLENTIDHLNAKVQSGMDMISKLLCKETDNKVYVSHVKGLLTQHTNYENVVSKEIEDISEIINISEQRRCEYETRYENISKHQEEIKLRIDELIKKVEEKAEIIQKQNAKITEMASSLSTTKSLVTHLKTNGNKEFLNLKYEIQKMQEIIISFQNQKHIQEKKLKQVENDLIAKDAEIMKLIEFKQLNEIKVKNQTEKTVEMESMKAEMEKKINEKSTEIAELKISLESVQNEMSNLEKMYNQGQEEFEQLKLTLNSLKGENEDMKTEVLEKTKEISDMKEKYNSCLKAKQLEVNELKDVDAKIRTERDEVVKQILKVKADLFEARNDIKKLNEKKANMRNQSNLNFSIDEEMEIRSIDLPRRRRSTESIKSAKLSFDFSKDELRKPILMPSVSTVQTMTAPKSHKPLEVLPFLVPKSTMQVVDNRPLARYLQSDSTHVPHQPIKKILRSNRRKSCSVHSERSSSSYRNFKLPLQAERKKTSSELSQGSVEFNKSIPETNEEAAQQSNMTIATNIDVTDVYRLSNIEIDDDDSDIPDMEESDFCIRVPKNIRNKK